MSAPEHERGAARRTAPTRCDAAPRQNVVTDRTPVVGPPVPEELGRRRLTAERSQPLPCGCRDPWTCRHEGGEPLDDDARDRWESAEAWLAGLGLPAVIPRQVRAALSLRRARRRFLATQGQA